MRHISKYSDNTWDTYHTESQTLKPDIENVGKHVSAFSGEHRDLELSTINPPYLVTGSCVLGPPRLFFGAKSIPFSATRLKISHEETSGLQKQEKAIALR